MQLHGRRQLASIHLPLATDIWLNMNICEMCALPHGRDSFQPFHPYGGAIRKRHHFLSSNFSNISIGGSASVQVIGAAVWNSF